MESFSKSKSMARIYISERNLVVSQAMQYYSRFIAKEKANKPDEADTAMVPLNIIFPEFSMVTDPHSFNKCNYYMSP